MVTERNVKRCSGKTCLQTIYGNDGIPYCTYEGDDCLNEESIFGRDPTRPLDCHRNLGERLNFSYRLLDIDNN